MKAKYTPVFLLILVLLVLACDSYKDFRNEATKNYSSEQMQKYVKYMIQGKILYTTHCSNCHQADGTGLGQVFPPLKESDYMLANQRRTYCLIKQGMKGEIVVNGKEYNQIMPDNQQLNNLEIAEIATYIYNSWGNETGMIGVQNVSDSLKKCVN